jgi:cell division protein FtsL
MAVREVTRGAAPVGRLSVPAPQQPAPDRRHLRVVPPGYVPARVRRRRARLLVLLAGVLMAAGLFGVVAFHVVLTQGQLDLQRLQARAAAGRAKEASLRLQVAQLESPERVVADAQRLGLTAPAQVRYLTPGTTVPPPAKPKR